MTARSRLPFFLALVASSIFAVAASGPAEFTIADIQRTDPAGGLDQQIVTRGIVTGDFTGSDDAHGDLAGFFIQSPPGDPDPFGLFVYTGRSEVDVARGDLVSVEGVVREFHGETQIEAGRVRTIGRGEVEPAELKLPASGIAQNADGQPIADLERYEGMLVRIDGPLIVAELRDIERYGELRLVASSRPFAFTQTNAPDQAGYAADRNDLARRTLRLDDGKRAQNVQAIRFLSSGPLRAGDELGELTGNLRYSRGSGGSGTEGWRLVPVEEPVFKRVNPRPPPPPRNGGLRVATVNVLNYFVTSSDKGDRCGPGRTSQCRGADSEQELARQLDKLAVAIAELDADIVGAVELENDPDDRSLATLVAAVNDRVGGAPYAFIPTGPIGNDAIRVGLIYRPDRVDLLGEHSILTSAVDSRFDDRRNRPVLAQTFRHEQTGSFTVAVAHLKSKGSPCDDSNDPDRDDGQGNCNQTRTRAALALSDWVTAETDTALIIGDLNAYAREDPVAALQAEGFVDLVDRFAGETAYTYVFDGQAGRLDHALATPALAEQVADAGVWHINADEARVLDYNLDYGRDEGLFESAHPWRFSDHDPVFVNFAESR